MISEPEIITDNVAIRVDGLGKKCTLGGRPQNQYLTLRNAIVNSLKAPMKLFRRTIKSEDFWAIKDVSFDVEHGEIIGII
jgi:lipopolysaccharide transport system ATP-binding protein